MTSLIQLLGIYVHSSMYICMAAGCLFKLSYTSCCTDCTWVLASCVCLQNAWRASSPEDCLEPWPAVHCTLYPWLAAPTDNPEYSTRTWVSVFTWFDIRNCVLFSQVYVCNCMCSVCTYALKQFADHVTIWAFALCRILLQQIFQDNLSSHSGLYCTNVHT